MLVDREVETDAGNQFIRPIEQDIVHQNRPNCGLLLRIYPTLAETFTCLARRPLDETDEAEVTNVATGAGTTLQLIEADKSSALSG